MKFRITIFRSAGGKFTSKIVSGNGRIVWSSGSQLYNRAGDAEKVARKFIQACIDAQVSVKRE